MLETLKNSLFADLGSFAISKVKSATQPKKKIPAYMTEEISDVDLLKQLPLKEVQLEKPEKSVEILKKVLNGMKAS